LPGTAIIGLVIGAVVKLLMPSKGPGGFIITMLLGLAGSFVAGYLGQLIGGTKKDSQGDLSCSFSGRFFCSICTGSLRERELLEPICP